MFEDLGRLLRYIVRLIFRPKQVKIGNYIVHIPENAKGSVLRSLYAERYEYYERKFINEYIKHDDRVLEIGSAIGFIGMHVAEIVGSDKLTLVEANPSLIGEMHLNFATNGIPEPKILNAAVSDKDGVCDFYFSEQFWASSADSSIRFSHSKQVDCVDVRKLQESFCPSVIIIDVEGGESVLCPLINYDDVRLIIVELHKDIIGEKKMNQIIELIKSSGLCLVNSIGEEVFIFERT